MLESLITSKTRINILLKFFLNSETRGYLRNLEQEFGESTNAIRIELNRMEDAGLLDSEFVGNRKIFKANTTHPLFADINNILRKFIGIDKIIENITQRIGNLEAAYLMGSLAKGINSKIIDLALVGTDLDRAYVSKLVEKAEALIQRKIRFIILTPEEVTNYFTDMPVLLIWKKDQSA